MRALALPISLLLALAFLGCGGKVDLLRVATSGRDGWQHPERVVQSLEIRSGDRVADIGAGDGYFLPWLSEAVGPTGRVYAVEVDAEKIDSLHATVQREGLENVEVVLGEFHDPLLPDEKIDLVLTCLTYHHIDDRIAYFARVRTDLSPRGRVAHLDDRDDLTGITGWMVTQDHWSNVDQMVAEMAEAGYQLVAGYDYLLTQSFQIFAPDASPATGHGS